MRYRVLNVDTEARTVELEIRSLRKLPSFQDLLSVVPADTIPVDIELLGIRYWLLRFQLKDPETYEQRLASFADSYVETKAEVMAFMDASDRKEETIETVSLILSGVAVIASVYVFYKSYIKEGD